MYVHIGERSDHIMCSTEIELTTSIHLCLLDLAISLECYPWSRAMSGESSGIEDQGEPFFLGSSHLHADGVHPQHMQVRGMQKIRTAQHSLLRILMCFICITHRFP